MTDGQVSDRVRTMTWPIAAISIVALMLVCALALLMLDAQGRSARVPHDGTVSRNLIVASTGVEALARLEQTGMKGAYLIQLGADSAFAPVDFSSSIPTDSIRADAVYPFRLVDVQRYYVENLRSDNYMLVAARTGLARKVDHVVAPGLFQEVRESALRDSSPDITVLRDSVTINSSGEVRRILPRLPRTSERFVLLVNASYFAQIAPETLAEALQPFLAQISYIAVSEEQDDPSVDAATREQARRFVELLAGGAQ